MNIKSILYLNLMIYLLLFSLNCERRFIVTEHTENPENQFIVGFCGTDWCPVTINNFYRQYFTVYGYDNSFISIKIDTLNLTEQENLTCREFIGQYELNYNQNLKIHFNIDNFSGVYSDIIPDSITIKNYQTNDTIPEGEPLVLEWDPVNNADYYFIGVRFNMDDIRFDTTLTTFNNQFTLSFEIIEYANYYTISIYAISGLPPKITNQSNIEGDIKGRIYIYSQIDIRIWHNVINIFNNKRNNPNQYYIDERFKKYMTNKYYRNLIGIKK
jgi:hypothetical protein